MQLNDLRVNLTLDNDGFKVTVRDSERLLRAFEQKIDDTARSVKKMENAFTSVGAQAHRMIMTLGMARFALMDIHDIFLRLPLAIVKSSGEIERMTKLMEGLSTQTDETKRKLEAAAGVKYVFNLAMNSPFEVKALQDAFIKFKSAGLDPTNGSLKALVDSVARFGGSSEQLHRASIAIQQMAGKGVVSMEELRQQLGEAVPTAMAMMAEGMGMSMAELTKAVSKGTVEANSALAKMFVVMKIANDGAAADMMNTWAGMTEQLKTKWELFKKSAGDAGAFDAAKKTLQDTLSAFDTKEAVAVAKEVGQTINEVLKGVVSLTKKVIDMAEYIKLAGEAFVLYWGASKAVGVLSTAKGWIDKVANAAQAAGDKQVAAAEAARIAKLSEINADIAAFQERIANNEKLIAAEQARVAAEKAALQEKLAAEAAANAQSILMAKDKAAALLAIEQELRMKAMGIELEAERIARQKKAGTAATARDMMADAGRITNNADILKAERDALMNNVAAYEARNAAIAKEIDWSRAANNVTNETITVLNNKNNALKQVIAQHEQQAKAIGIVNAASNMMTGIMGGVRAAIVGLLNPTNLLIAGIMAAAAAFEYFSNRAEHAKRVANSAIAAKEALEKGQADEKLLQERQERLKQLQDQLARHDQQAQAQYKVDEWGRTGINAIDQARYRLQGEIAQAQADVKAIQNQINRRDADMRAPELARMTQQMTNEGIAALRKSRAEQMEAYAKEIATVDPKNEALLNEMNKKHQEKLKKIDEDIVKATKTALTKRKSDLQVDIDTGTIKKDSAAYIAAVNEIKNIDEKLAQADQDLITLASAPRLLNPKDKKEKATKPTDALLNRLHSEQLALLQAKQLLAQLKGEVDEIGDLRTQAWEEVQMIIANDNHTKQIHTKADEQKLVETITQKRIIDEAVKQLRSLKIQLGNINAEIAALDEAAANGGEAKTKGSAEFGIVRLLEKIKEQAPAAKELLEQLAPAIEKVQSAAAERDTKKFIDEANKRIRDRYAATVMDDRQRAIASANAEVEEVRRKYRAIRAEDGKYGKDVTKLNELEAQEIGLIWQKLAREIETPLDKLVRQWENTTENMKKMTESWASNFMDMITSAASTGKLEFGKFIESVLQGILKIQLQQNIGRPIADIAKNAGDRVSGMLGWNKGGQGNDPTKDVSKNLSALGVEAKDLAGLFGNTLTNASDRAVQSLAEQVMTGSVKLSADQRATLSMTMLANAANQAAAALAQITASKAAGSGGGMLDGLLDGFFGGGDAYTDNLPDMGGLEAWASAFANGGIMTQFGPVALRKYAAGGIANSPQLALFGEGSMNEAYVPLPDGRTIPVTLNINGNAQQGGSAPSVTVNVINQSGQPVAAEQGQPRFDGKQMILEVVLTAVNTPGPFRSGMQQALK